MTRELDFKWPDLFDADDWYPLQCGVDMLPDDLRIEGLTHVATRKGKVDGRTYYVCVGDGRYHLVRYVASEHFNGINLTERLTLNVRYGDDDEIVEPEESSDATA